MTTAKKTSRGEILPTYESNTHAAVAQYLKVAYPRAIFNTDLSGIRLRMSQAIKAKELRSSRSFPDIVVYEPRRGFHGLFIELKRTGEKTHRKDGELVADKHIQEQAEMLRKLTERGYYATFAVGFIAAKAIIDWYLNERKEYNTGAEQGAPPATSL